MDRGLGESHFPEGSMNLEPVRAAIHAAIADNPAGLKGESIASRMLLSKSTLYAYGESDSEGDARKSIPLERLIQFSLITEDGRALTALCALAGYACIRLPAKVAPGAELAALKALHEFSSFMTENSQALMDGLIEPEELERIERRADAAMYSIAQVVAIARRQREEAKTR